MVSAQFTAAANAAKQLKAKPSDDELLQVGFLCSIFDPAEHQSHLNVLNTPHSGADGKGEVSPPRLSTQAAHRLRRQQARIREY